MSEYYENTGKVKSSGKNRDSKKPVNKEKDYFGEKPCKLDSFLSEPGRKDNKEKDMTTLTKSKKFPGINQSLNNEKQSGLYSSPRRIVTRYTKDGEPVKVKIYPDGTEKIIIGDKEYSPVSFMNQSYNKSKPTFTKNKKNPITQSKTNPKNEPNQKEKTNPKIDDLKRPIEKDPDILGKILASPPKKITKKANKTVETGRMYYMKNIDTQKRYIGQTIKTTDERLSKHFTESKYNRDNTFLNNSIRKHGREKFTIHEFQTIENQKQWVLDKMETHYISKYHTQDPRYGYNIAPGGKGGKHAQETIEKIKQSNIKAKAHLKGKPISEQHRQNISKGLMNHVHSEETKQKIAKSQTGKTLSEETKEKLSQINTGENNPFFGKKHSESTLEKMSDNKMGEKNPFHGKHHNKESKKLIGKAKKGIPNTTEQKRKISETKIQNFKDSNPINEVDFKNAVANGASTREIAEEFKLRRSAVHTWLGHFYDTSNIIEAREKAKKQSQSSKNKSD